MDEVEFEYFDSPSENIAVDDVLRKIVTVRDLLCKQAESIASTDENHAFAKEQMEILKKENEILKNENEILKKEKFDNIYHIRVKIYQEAIISRYKSGMAKISKLAQDCENTFLRTIDLKKP